MTRMHLLTGEFTGRPRGPRRAIRVPLALALLWSGLAAAQDAASTTPEPLTAATVFEQRVPFQRWPRLGPQAVGLLVVRGSPWGHAGALTVSGRRSGGDEHFQFYVEGRSPGSFMMPARGTGPNVSEPSRPVELPDGGVVRAVMSLAQGTIPKLKAAAHLVRVTVNGGEGFYGDGALYSDLKVLDGTAEHPIVIARTMHEAKARWDRYRAAQQGAFNRVMEEGRRRIEADVAATYRRDPEVPEVRPYGPSDPEGRLPPGVAPSRVQARFGPDRDTVYAGFFPSWRDDPGELSLLFGHQLFRERSRSFREMQISTCPPGAPCLHPMMVTTTEQKTHGAAIAYAITFDRNGKVIREEPFPPVPVEPPSTARRNARMTQPWKPPPTVQPPRGTGRR